MEVDNGYIPAKNYEKFTTLLDTLGVEYEYDKPTISELYFSGWIDLEGKKEIKFYEACFELCDGINYKDEPKDFKFFKDELATKNNTFVKHNNVLFDANKLAFAGIPVNDLILIFNNGQYLRVKGRKKSLLIFNMIKDIIGMSINIDQRNYVFRADFLINVRTLQSSEYRPKNNEMYLTFKHGNYQSMCTTKEFYDDLSNEFLDILNSVIKRGCCG